MVRCVLEYAPRARRGWKRLRDTRVAFSDAPNRPPRVLRDQRLGVLRGTFQRGQISRRADISQRHAHVAQKAAAFDALDRGLAKKRRELLIREREKISERHR